MKCCKICGWWKKNKEMGNWWKIWPYIALVVLVVLGAGLMLYGNRSEWEWGSINWKPLGGTIILFTGIACILCRISKSCTLWWKKYGEVTLGVLAAIAIIIAIIIGIGYILFYKNGWCHYIGGICIGLNISDDKDIVATALALAGTVLVIANMWFIIIRIRNTDKQIEVQQDKNYLDTLYRGTIYCIRANLYNRDVVLSTCTASR